VKSPVKLLGFSSRLGRFQIIRDLTAQEIEADAKFTPIVAEASCRLKLFRILQKNYDDWQSYIYTLLDPRTRGDDDAMDELDRLLLNYLTCAYTIREHFRVSFMRRFRNDPTRQNQYLGFVQALCKQSWAFAFLLDFRGYVQHVGLAVGKYQRQVGISSVSVSVTQDAKALLEGSRLWRLSNLTEHHGDIDLVKTVQEFHIHMLQHYALFVVRTFFPELVPGHQFYAKLTEEVKRIDRSLQMGFAHGSLDPKQEANAIRLDLEITTRPNDLLAELGIQLKQADLS
jgi:hypothetical protein